MAKNGNKKKNKKKIIIFSILGVIVLTLVLFVIFSGNKEEIISVQIEKTQKRTITQTVTATGIIDPEFKVIINPEVTGEIVALPVKEGDVVKKGQVLLKIKSERYLAAKERAEANLQSNKATLNRVKAELDKVASDYKRTKELHQKKLSSDSELEAAKSFFLSAEANYESYQSIVLQSQAALRESMEDLNKTIITSPMDGIITKLNIELGQRVLGSGFSQGTDIMTVADLSNMEAIVDVDENDIPVLSVGDTARIKVDAFGDRSFNGIVSQIGNSAKSQGIGTQDKVINFEVRIKLLELDKNLKPGMSCNASIETETKKDVWSVPIQSVTARTPEFEKKEDEQIIASTVAEKKKENKIQEIVFIVENNKAKTLKVKTGISDDNFIEIIDGVKGTEEVVTGSFKAISRELKDGSLVKIDKKDRFKADKKN